MSTAAAPASHRTWAIETTRSEVTFTAWVLGRLPVRGRFPSAVTGAVVLDGDVASGAATLTTAALDTGLGRRDRHLKSADFLDVARHETISLRVENAARRAGPQRVVAAITIKGVTTHAAVEIELTEAAGSLSAVVRGRLRRRTVQIVPGWIADLAVGREFTFEARIATVAT